MLNPIECCCTDKFQYLVIHKNGCSSLLSTITKNHPHAANDYVVYDRPLFAVLRDPWERTISGIAYDIQRSFGYFEDSLLDKINIPRMLYQPIPPLNKKQRQKGFISHICVQTAYLFDVNPTFYLMINDLSNFMQIHFKSDTIQHLNKSDTVLKKQVEDAIFNRQQLKNDIAKYLAIDYYLIERIRNTELLWDFSMGKMW